MNCRETKRKMTAYLDGELARWERDAFFEHLQECSACCDLIGEASYYEVTLGVTLKQRMEAPAAIRQNVMSAISARNARRAAPVWKFGWPRLALRPAAAFATVLTLAGAGWRTFSQNFQPDPSVRVNVQEPRRQVASVPAPTAARASKPKPSETRAAKPAVSAPLATSPRAPIVPKARPATPPAPTLAPPAAPSAPAKQPRETVRPADAPRTPEVSAPTMVASNAPEQTVGTVSYVWAPDNVMNGRFLSRSEAARDWVEASYDLGIRTHLQTSESTVIEMTLKDGTHLKSNESTEFVVQRAPTRDDASWGIRLVRGDLWVRGVSGVDVEIIAPGVSVRGSGAEFSVRSFDGQDATVMVVDGDVVCENPNGAVNVSAGQASVAVVGEAPRQAFATTEIAGHLEWAYRAKDAYSALDNGMLPR